MKDTLKNIDDILLKINTHPDYSKSVYNKFSSYLREESFKHSIDMEINQERKAYSRKKFESSRRACLKNLKNAKKFLDENYITLYSLSSLGKIIEPEKNKNPIRIKEVSYGDWFEPPLGQEEIYLRLNNLEYMLNKNSDIHPVALASGAHLGMVEIHPFMDGNGRAARVLQNNVLEKAGYPSAIISSDESELYRSIINGVMHDRYSGNSNFFSPSRSEKIFNLYIAGKVLQSCKDLQKELSEKKAYTIYLKELQDKEISFTVKNAILNLLKSKTDLGIKFSREQIDGKTTKIDYQGKHRPEFFMEELNRLSNKYGFKYEIEKR